MALPKRHLRPMRNRLGPGEQILVGVQGTLARTGALVLGFLLGAAATLPLVYVFQKMADGRYTYVCLGPPMLGVALATRRRPLSPGDPPFPIPMHHALVLTTHELYVWASTSMTPTPGQRPSPLAHLVASIRNDAIATVGEADGMLEVRLHSGHSIRSKMARRHRRRFMTSWTGAAAVATAGPY